MKYLIIKYMKDDLFKNSSFIFISRMSNVIVGFLFWLVAARYYNISDVGTAAVLFSWISVILTFSRLGYDTSLVRFISFDKVKIFVTCIYITTISSIIMCILSIFLIKIFTPSLVINGTFYIILLIISICNSITATESNYFVATKQGFRLLIQSIFLALRIPLLIPFSTFNDFGILLSLSISFLLSSLSGLYWISKLENFGLKFDGRFARESFNFSFLNYISTLFYTLPLLVMPMIVLNLLGPDETAKFYIVLNLGIAMVMIPDAISRSLYVEGCSNLKSFKLNMINAIKGTYCLLGLSFLFILIFGKNLLELFGSNYTSAYELLKIISFANFSVAVVLLFTPIQNIRLKVGSIVFYNFIRCILLLILPFALVPIFNFAGIGYSWLIGNLIISILMIYSIRDYFH